MSHESTTQRYNKNQHYNHYIISQTSLTYGGAQAMDVTGGDKTWVLCKGKDPPRVIVKRSIGQWDRT